MASISQKKLVLITAIAAILFAGFTALGIWQVYRLQWKRDLIAAVDARVDAPAVPAPGAGETVAREDDAYRHVSVTGRYIEAAQTLIYYPTQLGAGYFVMTPLLRDDGSYVLINRGFVPEGRQDNPANYRAPEGEVTVRDMVDGHQVVLHRQHRLEEVLPGRVGEALRGQGVPRHGAGDTCA